MRQIQLNNGSVALVDDQDFDVVSAHSWQATVRHGPGPTYAATHIRVAGRKVWVRMHRLILGLQPGQQCDHRDGNGLNNTRLNLRICTSRQNSWNRSKSTGAKISQYKGVYFEPIGKRGQYVARPWTAKITVLGRRKRLGNFLTEVEAAKGYDTAAILHFGEYARLNFPLVAVA